MIVPMKKISVVMQAKDAEEVMGSLRKLGVLHVTHQKPPSGEEVVSLQNEIALVDAALGIFSQPEFFEREPSQTRLPFEDWRLSVRHIIDAHKRLDQLQEYSQALKSRIHEWQPWGDFDPQAIARLEEKNIFLSLYQVPIKELPELPAKAVVEIVAKIKGVAYCVLVSKGTKARIPFKEAILPKMGLAKMLDRLQEDTRTIEKIRSNIKKHNCYRAHLIQVRQSLAKELEFRQALRGMGQSHAFKYVGGFIPYDAVEKIKAVASDERWGVLVTEPAQDDEVPTLLRNPAWVRLIKPVLRLLEIVPGYHELDVSFLFLIFFSLFFGILIGDAGYGLVYLLLTFLLQKKQGKKTQGRNYFSLFYVLSFCAILWGILTGTFFGQEWCARIGLRPLVPALNKPKVMQSVCFFIGAFHLSIAHSWRAVLKSPSLAALSEVGWICVLWSGFFFACMLILGESLPWFVPYLLYTGIGLVVLFTNPQKNILKGIGQGLGTLALSLMNNFTDVVSYVRLFAVGMASLAIAETANTMAAGLSGNPIIFAITVPLILIVGHVLNIILGPISVLVHGVRLNVLEFSGHAGVSWSGSAYKPFKEQES